MSIYVGSTRSSSATNRTSALDGRLVLWCTFRLLLFIIPGEQGQMTGTATSWEVRRRMRRVLFKVEEIKGPGEKRRGADAVC